MAISTIIIVSAFIVLAAACNAVMDTLKDHYAISWFAKLGKPQFWDASVSWTNKYINNDKAQGRTYWRVLGIKIIKPSIITDGWHLFKFFMQLCIGGAFGMLCPFGIGLPAFFVCWVIGFEPLYTLLSRKV